MKKSAVGLVLAALVFGGLGGYALGNSMGDDSDNKAVTSSQPTTDTKAADLRAMLTGLQQEHVALASAATRAGFDGARNFPAAAASLDNNTNDLAAAVGSVYGADAQKQFDDIWTSHIGFFVDYTTGAKAGDKAKMDKAVKDLGGYVDAISTFFSGANPNLPKEAVAQLINEHVMLLKGTVDKYGAGDLAGSYEQERQTREQIDGIAATISGAIVKQSPDKFTGSATKSE
ncbi:MAG: hypothetical protein M3Q14_00210 [bacterium]|nr:hypothetical protein [bacterium]